MRSSLLSLGESEDSHGSTNKIKDKTVKDLQIGTAPRVQNCMNLSKSHNKKKAHNRTMASVPMLACKQRRRCDNIKAESRDLDTLLCLKKKLQITPRTVDIPHHN